MTAADADATDALGPTTEAWSHLERQLCTDLPAPLEHAPDADGHNWYDATLVAPYEATPALPVYGRPARPTTAAGCDAGASPAYLPAGTRVEIKTCARWHSNGGDARRRGRWVIHSGNHQRRVGAGAAYLLAVRGLEVAVLATARWVDALLARRGSWTTGDRHHPGRQCANLSWGVVFEPDAVGGGGGGGGGGEA